MKNLFYIVLFLGHIAAAQTAFEQGNAHYNKGSYKEAAQSYESVIAGGEESAELYFNLGNAYYHLKKAGPAIYNYEKALQLDPGNKKVLVNLGFAQKLAVDDIKAAPEGGIAGIVYNWAGNFHYNSWAWAGVAFGLGSFLLFIGYYFTMKEVFRQGFFAGFIAAIFFMVICIGFAFFVRSVATQDRTAIVFAHSATLKDGSQSNAGGNLQVHEGTKVTIVKEAGNKIKIELADETTGWIDKNAIKEL